MTAYKSPIVLTDKGLEVGEKTAQKIDRVLDEVSVGLSDEEREEFSKTLVYDRLFHMWVFSKGYGKQLREWLLTLEEDF